MGFLERSFTISLAPRDDGRILAFTASGYWTLARWILWHPRALKSYVDRIKRDNPNSISTHLAHFSTFLFLCLLVLSLGAVIITAGIATRPVIISNLVISWGILIHLIVFLMQNNFGNLQIYDG